VRHQIKATQSWLGRKLSTKNIGNSDAAALISRKEKWLFMLIFGIIKKSSKKSVSFGQVMHLYI